MVSDSSQLAYAKDAISMLGFLVLREVESHSYASADGARVLTGTWRVSSPANPAKPLLYMGYLLQQGMVSLTCTPPGELTRTWSLLLDDSVGWMALVTELRVIYQALLPENERRLMTAHVTRVAHQRMG